MEHDDRAGLSLQAHIISGNDEEKDWTAESAKQRNAATPEQGKNFFPLLYLSRWSSNLKGGYCHGTHPVAVTPAHGPRHPLYLRSEILILVLFFIRTS